MEHEPDLTSLVTPARVAVALCVLTLVALNVRALHRARPDAARPLLLACVLVGVPATALSIQPMGPLALTLLPIGVFVGLGLAVASVFHAPTREAFESLDDGNVRSLLGYRATFGAFLFAGAALELFPPSFAWTAGLGDLLVGWLAHVATGSLGRGGSRGWRLLVHGVGLVDLVQVVVLAMTIVRPWLAHRAELGELVLGPPLVLPWIGVPLMLAINLHGLRSAWRERPSEVPDAQLAS